MKFLIVDDSAIIRRKIIHAFLSYDVEFDEAADGNEALALLSIFEEDYDLITLDWHMPDLCGLEVLEKIKEQGLSIPTLMVTTENQKSEVVKAMLKGAKNYLVKPFDSPSLIKKVSDTLQLVGKSLPGK